MTLTSMPNSSRRSYSSGGHSAVARSRVLRAGAPHHGGRADPRGAARSAGDAAYQSARGPNEPGSSRRSESAARVDALVAEVGLERGEGLDGVPVDVDDGVREPRPDLGGGPTGSRRHARKLAVACLLPQGTARYDRRPMTSTEPARTSTRREEIVVIAKGLFADKGYAATSTRDIAEACGLLPGSLYSHFRSKAQILEIVIGPFYARLIEEQHAALAADGPGAHRLETMIRHVLRAVRRPRGRDQDPALRLAPRVRRRGARGAGRGGQRDARPVAAGSRPGRRRRVAAPDAAARDRGPHDHEHDPRRPRPPALRHASRPRASVRSRRPLRRGRRPAHRAACAA